MRPLQPLPPQSRWAAKPVAIASANGLRGVQKAFDMLMQGADTLDAIIEGVKIQELDPTDMSVGYGGLPNRDGVVQLDAACMHRPTKRAGAVGCLENIKTPSEVAKLVLKYTNHVFLVGRSEEHTSELQSRLHLVCRLLLEKKKQKHIKCLTCTLW